MFGAHSETSLERMKNYYVPYSGSEPAAVTINGHRLIILAKNRGVIQDALERIGADRVRRLRSQGEEHEEVMLEELARSVRGGVVIAPRGADVDELIRDLELQLPWLQ